VTVPADDLHLTFDGADVASLPSTILVAASLDAALEEMEAALLSRTRHALEETESRPTAASLVLLGSPAPYAGCRPCSTTVPTSLVVERRRSKPSQPNSLTVIKYVSRNSTVGKHDTTSGETAGQCASFD
jgi:hypothetical protein